MPNNTLIIAAMSARGYAQAAVACGYDVVTIDAFADAETCSVAKQAFKVKVTEHGVDFADFKSIFADLNLNEYDGLLYGSLFDNATELLAWTAEQVRVIGNKPELMSFAKSFAFFDLLQEFKIRCPEVLLCEKLPYTSFTSKSKVLVVPKLVPNYGANAENEGQWLIKQLGGTGGAHIKLASQSNKNVALQYQHYFQKKIEGIPVSMLFVANGQMAKTIGINLQLLAPTERMPYRFAGAVSYYKLPLKTQEVFEDVAQQLTQKLNLMGCNSLDAIFDGEDLWILELNPRLSASFHLYPNMTQVHLQGCMGNLMPLPPITSAFAQLVIYADKTIEIPSYFVWPNGVTDIPNVKVGTSVKIEQYYPICTVRAEAKTADAAHELVLEKAKQLKRRFL